MDVRQVAQRFAKAHHSYADAAVVQAGICTRLVQMLGEQACESHFARTLEIGCGAGGLTHQFLANFTTDTLYLNDLYDDVVYNNLTISPEKCQFLIGDINTLPLPDTLDLVLSASALQWIYPLDRLLDRLAQALKTNGLLAIGSFAQQNLWQMRTLTGVGLDYYTTDALAELVERSGFEILSLIDYLEMLHFKTPRAVLKHLQATGVTGGAQFVWTKATLEKFYDKYQSLAEDAGVPLTYHPVLMIARKKV